MKIQNDVVEKSVKKIKVVESKVTKPSSKGYP